ncbi:hypothetical protein E2C01_083265 [Portunus trituberculatus]|uniref:Uncharacterized protein n=1 Tax=Portunus trituberculatus TaxID=210409 RepID=A0A5B7J7C4_PORTR|nr:hypothetical protein [Portunus trituberculatus]
MVLVVGVRNQHTNNSSRCSRAPHYDHHHQHHCHHHHPPQQLPAPPKVAVVSACNDICYPLASALC